MDVEKIGNFIKEMRKKANLTQKELALKLNVTDRAVSKWERGVGLPDISIIEVLAKELNVSIVDIFKGEKVKEIEEKHFVDSLKLVEKNYKQKMKYYFDKICVFVIMIVVLLLAFYNFRSSYYVHKNYKIDRQYSMSSNNTYNSIKNIKRDIDLKVEKIKNNRGSYNDEDYKTILEFISKIEQIDFEYDLEIINKESLKISDIDIKFLKNQSGIFEKDYYAIMFNYNTPTYKRVNFFDQTDYREYLSELITYKANIFNYNVEYLNINIMKDVIFYKYYNIKHVLTDIVSAGDIK